MDTNKPIVEELLQLKQGLHSRMEALRKVFEQTKQDYDSVANTLKLLGYKEESVATSRPVFQNSEKLVGLTQGQALARVARQNGGILRVRDAKQLLLDAGLIKTAKNANNIIFNVIKREEGVWKRIAPGEYELLRREEKPLLAEAAHR